MLSSDQVIHYLALLSDPAQNLMTRQMWSVIDASDAKAHADFVWAGWQPESVVSVANEPPSSWYEPEREKPDGWASVEKGLDNALGATVVPLRIAARITAAVADGRQAEARQAAKARQAHAETEWTPPPGAAGGGLARLAALDELHYEEALGRVGWLFIVGSIDRDGEHIQCCFPLFERWVHFAKVRGEILPRWLGALQRSPLLARRGGDPQIGQKDPVEAFVANGVGTRDIANLGVDVARMLQPLGVSLSSITDPSANPISLLPQMGAPEIGTVLVPGTGFYLARSGIRHSTNNRLRGWADRYLGGTALAGLYLCDDAGDHQDEQPAASSTAEESATSALPLNRRQADAISRLSDEPVVVVSGPPGTGKTHMVVAAASDAVARGMSVLVATKSDFAAESICELLDHYPTPPHIRFGRADQRRYVADLLSDGTAAGISDEDLAILDEANRAALRRVDEVGSELLAALERKQAFERARAVASPEAALVPAMMEPGFNHEALTRLERQAREHSGFRQRRAHGRLAKLVGAPENTSHAQVTRGVEAGRAELAIRDALDHAKGSELDDIWSELDRADERARTTSAVVSIASRSRPSPEATSSIASLATALRASADSTNGQLGSNLDWTTDAAFLHHLPFWVGTLDEIGATLPELAAMFDLVIFDEASQIDQLSAVPALCRARQVMVVGDPRQLRHQPTVTASQIEAARLHASIDDASPTSALDVVENSLFDVAAAAAPVTWLDEHFRSTPHLIQFASDRWYRGELRLMTQHPRNEHLDAIETVRLTSRRASQVNQGEVDAIVEHIGDLLADDDAGSIAVVTPFEAQAAALERALVDSFSFETIRDRRLRVGTVRGVQGTERDIVLLSLVIDERDFDTTLATIENPNAFNVMTTRARHQLTMFHSFDPAALPAGLLADWFRYENTPPGAPSTGAIAPSKWTQALADALRLGGARVVVNYPVAGWTVDLVIGEGAAALAVETTVHPDGPRAHVDRHLALRRAGWDLVSVFESSWLLQPEDAAIHIAGLVARRGA